MTDENELRFPENSGCTFMDPDRIKICAQIGCQAKAILDSLEEEGNIPGAAKRRKKIIAEAKAAGCKCDLE